MLKTEPMLRQLIIFSRAAHSGASDAHFRGVTLNKFFSFWSLNYYAHFRACLQDYSEAMKLILTL